MTEQRPRNRWDDILEESAASYFAGRLADTPTNAEIGEVAGTVVGRYRLVEEIGRGGMGAVWLAERADEQFDHRVALKLIKRGMDSDEILARFLRERQILARLEHPNIARLFDGGVAADGRPYFVMEFVAGEPITRYCDTRQLSVRERLTLFVLTCRAVQYAHRSLVVHRDLKPSNVLVTSDGDVKLLDFGIARLVATDVDGVTAERRGPMTPEYASPEQLAGEPVTTSGDVYQLGILLYELLCGHRPWGPRRRADDVLEAMNSGSLPRPSTATASVEQVLRSDGTSITINADHVSTQRASTPDRLRHQLKGDLDTIALTALRREPDRRYQSVEALAEDVERHLDGLPIRVRDTELAYRSLKFVSRYRIRVATTVVALMSLVGGVAFYTSRIRQERDAALLESAKSAEGAELVRQMFGTWSPDASDRGAVSARTILRNAVRRAETELARQPEMLAASLSVLGELHTNLGDAATADSLLTRALAIQDKPNRPPNADLAATLARRGRLLSFTRRHADGAQLLRRSHRIFEVLFGPRSLETLRVKRDLATHARTEGDLREAKRLLTEVRDVLRDAADVSPFALEVASGLGYVYFLQARYDEAVPLLREALSEQRRMFGEQYAPALETSRFLASALRDRGDLVEAEQLYREALRIYGELYGDEHEQTGYAGIALSLLLERTGSLEEAEILARESMRILGPNSMGTPLQLIRLGGIRLDRGDPVEAERLLRVGLDSLKRMYPAGNADEADALNRLAFLLMSRGASEAERAYRAAAVFDRARPSESPVFVSDGLHFLAWAHHRQRDIVAAEDTYRRALALYRVQLPPGHPYITFTEEGLRQVLAESGRAP